MDKIAKIVLFFDRAHKSFLIYESIKDLKSRKVPFKEKSEINSPPALNDIYQEWEIDKIDYSKNKLSIDFKLLLVNKSFGRMDLSENKSDNKVVLYITDDKRCYIKYNNIDDLRYGLFPEHYEDKGVLKNLNTIKEKWILKNVDAGDKKIKLDFKLLLRKK